MLYILLGEDDFSIHQSLEEIKRSFGDQALLEANTSLLDGQQVTLNQLRAVCEALPFLSERRLVIIKGLMERFESKRKFSSKKASRMLKQQNEHKPFLCPALK